MRQWVLLLILVALQLGGAEHLPEEPVTALHRGALRHSPAATNNAVAQLLCLMGFMHWPGEPRQGPVVIGIVGSDRDERMWREGLEGRMLSGRPLELRLVSRTEEMKRCDMLLVGSTLSSRARQILAQLDGAGVLTIAAIPGFGQMGGMVELAGFGQSPGKGIVLNADAARRSGFSFRAGLLAVVSITRSQGFAE